MSANASDTDPCTNLHFVEPISPGLNSMEKRLACGSGSGDKNVTFEWRDIPASQRTFSLKSFLQSRGYQEPRFELRDDKLWVNPGKKLKVSRVEILGAPENFQFSRKRKLIGAILTPSFLDDLKNWTLARLRGIGYGCPNVNLAANPKTGVVTLSIDAASVGTLAKIEESDVPGLLPGIFRRYDAFEIGDQFNGDLLNLTETRVQTEGQVESLKLRVDHCDAHQVYVKQSVVAGKPRLLTLGGGANTEGVILGTAEWKHVRLGNTASLIDVSVSASTIDQLFYALGNWYFLPFPSRLYLKPEISSDHENMNPFEYYSFREEGTLQTSFDTQGVGFQLGSGPVYDYVRTIRGAGQPTARLLFWETTLRTATHYFDFYQTSPRSGFQAQLTTDFSDRSVYSDFDVQRFQLNVESLWNYKEYSPPLLVFGLRGSAAVTATDTADAYSALVPPNLRQYLGGSQTLRGFGLLELPEDSVGRLTSVFGSFETRLVDTLPLGIQPFVFADAGWLGRRSVRLDPTVYWSPGLGLRLQTPIGNFRTTLAHGYLTGNSDPSASHFQVFVSYGEEF
jgi:outer membrane translocation and assembly module TamA